MLARLRPGSGGLGIGFIFKGHMDVPFRDATCIEEETEMEFTGDQERLIRFALSALAESDREELNEIDSRRVELDKREALLQDRIGEIEHTLSLPFGN